MTLARTCSSGITSRRIVSELHHRGASRATGAVPKPTLGRPLPSPGVSGGSGQLLPVLALLLLRVVHLPLTMNRFHFTLVVACLLTLFFRVLRVP